MVFRGDFYEANPGSSTRNIEANRIHVESSSPPYVRPGYRRYTGHAVIRAGRSRHMPSYPHPLVNDDHKHAISAEGKAEAEAELKHLTEVRRPVIVAAIKAAREEGDLSENAEYHAAREEQGLNEARIRNLENLLRTAQVTEAASGDVVGVGSKVSFRDSATGSVTEVTLVHRLEADTAAGKLSVESPIAGALLGATAGDTVTAATPAGAKQLEVLEVG